MKIIFVNGPKGRTRAYELNSLSNVWLSICVLGIPLGLLCLGYYTGTRIEEPKISLSVLQSEAQEHAQEIAAIQADAKSEIRAISVALGKLQARLTLMDSVGLHLADLVGIDNEELDFSSEPAIGGPLQQDFDSGKQSQLDLLDQIQNLDEKISDRIYKLDTVEQLILDRSIKENAEISGWPVKKGWISSHFGRRTDPFTGKPAMHYGVDFAGSEGHQVLSLAAGVITHSGYKQGYGQMVEISHGDGFNTRYAHAQENLVKIGQIVEKGEPIALVGSTGRSTGAHVHLEVYKNGKPVDPSSYIKRTQP